MDGHGAPVQRLPGTWFCVAGVVRDHVHPNCRIDDVRLVVIFSFFSFNDTKEKGLVHMEFMGPHVISVESCL